MISSDSFNDVWNDVERIRSQSPLVHNITNYVVMGFSANALLALGASPVMAHAPEEVQEMTRISRALVLNIGTLSEPWVESMVLAGQEAGRRGIPIVLDPVGCGATRYRTDTALRLLREIKPAIIRGNASEILALVDSNSSTKGVDSTDHPMKAVEAAVELNRQHDCVISISGAEDYIVGRERKIVNLGGHPSMARVTGMGCTATAVTAAFAAVNGDPVSAAAHAMAVMGVAGEMAGEKAQGPGSFAVEFLDALHRLDAEALKARLKWKEHGSGE